MMPRFRIARGAAVALALLAPAAAAAPAGTPAEALVASVERAMGGREAWERLDYVAFTFRVSRNDTTLSARSLRWEKSTGRLRVEGTDREGRRYVVATDLAHRDGRVLLDGAPPDSAMRAALLERAHRIWVNDTYWLLMPWKLRDPGVMCADAGPDSSGRERLLHLRFEKVGLTPDDQYWVHIDPASGRITGWEMLLQGATDGIRRPVEWTDWRDFAGVRLATRRVFRHEPNVIRFEDILLAERAPAGAFEP